MGLTLKGTDVFPNECANRGYCQAAISFAN